VSRYQKKHSPTQHSSWSSIIPICFLHLLRTMASSVFNPRALQSFSTISFQVLFGLPLGLVPSTHTPYISLPNHCLLFAAHAHTIATCSLKPGRLKPIWFTGARDSEWQWHLLGYMQSAPHPRQPCQHPITQYYHSHIFKNFCFILVFCACN